MIILIIWTKFAPKKGIFGQKSKNWTPPLNFAYSDYSDIFQISTQTDNFDLLDQIYPKRVFLVKNRKREHHHWILHIWIGLGTKFQLRLTILIFCAKFAQKGCSQSKTANFNLVPSASFRYKRKTKKRPWNTSNTWLKFAQIEGIFFQNKLRNTWTVTLKTGLLRLQV